MLSWKYFVIRLRSINRLMNLIFCHYFSENILPWEGISRVALLFSKLYIFYSIHVPGWLQKWLNLITAPGSVSNEPGSVTWLATKYLKTVSWRNHTEKLTTWWAQNLSSTLPEIDPDTAYVVCISICPYFLIWYPYAPTSLYGNTAHCSGYGVAMGCYGLFIVTRTAIVTSQWYDRYWFTEYARTWARHPATPWQRECTAITDRQSIDSLLNSMRFVTLFWEITPYILRDATEVLVQSHRYSINARPSALGHLIELVSLVAWLAASCARG